MRKGARRRNVGPPHAQVQIDLPSMVLRHEKDRRRILSEQLNEAVRRLARLLDDTRCEDRGGGSQELHQLLGQARRNEPGRCICQF